MPLRRFVLSLAEHHPNLVVLLVLGFLVFDTAAGAFAIIQIHDQQSQLTRTAKQRAYELCVTSNGARRSLRDLLLFAEERTKQTAQQTGTTPEQFRNALDFYDTALSRIKIIDCPKP